MGMVQYTVSTLKNLRAAKYGDPAVRVTLTDVQGTRNNLLETGETATVELDTGRMGFTAATLGADDRVTIEVRPAIGASLPFARTIPPRMEAGATYRVY
jgi:flagellin FlaB